MARKADLANKIEKGLGEDSGVQIDPELYKKPELELMLARVSKDEDISDMLKQSSTEGGDAEPTSGGRSIQVTDPSTGEEMPRQDYIRQEFEKDRHRREIAEELGVAYQIIFGATRDMTNKHHAPGKRGSNSSLVTITDEDGEEHEVKRSEYMREEYRKGRERSDIGSDLGVSYGLVYSATKDIERDPEVVARYKADHQGEGASDSDSEDTNDDSAVTDSTEVMQDPDDDAGETDQSLLPPQ